MAFTNTCGFFHCMFVMNVSPTQKKKKKKNTAYEALANTYASSLWVWKLHCGKLHGSQRVVHPTVFDKLLLGGELFPRHHPAASSFRTPKQVSVTHSAHMISCNSPMLSLPQLPAMCVSFLGTLLDLGGVQHGNQLSQLLCFTHKGSCGAPTTCQWGCGAGDSSLPTS